MTKTVRILLILLAELFILALIFWDYRQIAVDTFFAAKDSALKLLNKNGGMAE